ncbi:hypothetical protein PoB_007461000 [Plakobranchus ocellatus]|uniref:Uncharacterized protein n=1 Tax=Plakobranchus ocellatus TaxID=259542 RepID=A0AAV4DVL5_9GAST|nr:hypothetical protein PoB_007461000 [Plakobranchus ocellatus]
MEQNNNQCGMLRMEQNNNQCGMLGMEQNNNQCGMLGMEQKTTNQCSMLGMEQKTTNQCGMLGMEQNNNKPVRFFGLEAEPDVEQRSYHKRRLRMSPEFSEADIRLLLEGDCPTESKPSFDMFLLLLPLIFAFFAGLLCPRSALPIFTSPASTITCPK